MEAGGDNRGAQGHYTVGKGERSVAVAVAALLA